VLFLEHGDDQQLGEFKPEFAEFFYRQVMAAVCCE
jgi:hypothetical protein